MKKLLGVAGILLLLFGLATAGLATSADPVEIFYSITNLSPKTDSSPGTWEYSYTLQNNSLLIPYNDGTNTYQFGVMWFTTFFPVDEQHHTSLYSNIQVLTPVDPADPWAHRTVATEPFELRDSSHPEYGYFLGGPRGMYDSQTTEPSAAILPGYSLSGFSVGFSYSGDGTPGPQSFQLLDANVYDLHTYPMTGYKVAAEGVTEPNPVPVPPSAFMLLPGLVGLWIVRKKCSSLCKRV